MRNCILLARFPCSSVCSVPTLSGPRSGWCHFTAILNYSYAKTKNNQILLRLVHQNPGRCLKKCISGLATISFRIFSGDLVRSLGNHEFKMMFLHLRRNFKSFTLQEGNPEKLPPPFPRQNTGAPAPAHHPWAASASSFRFSSSFLLGSAAIRISSPLPFVVPLQLRWWSHLSPVG